MDPNKLVNFKTKFLSITTLTTLIEHTLSGESVNELSLLLFWIGVQIRM